MNTTLLAQSRSLIAVLAIGLSLATAFGCREAISESAGAREAPAITAPPSETGQYEGVVMSPAPQPFIIMSDDGMQHSFVVRPETKIQIDGHDAKLESIKTGDTAKVKAHQRDGQFIALAISVESSHVAH